LLAPLALGCGDAGGLPLFPVAGRITVDGQPLCAEQATVVFKPDKGRGNLTDHEPVGRVDPNGNFTLATAGKQGAPPGWYKVVVAAFEAPRNDRRLPGKPARGYRLLANRRYGDAETSGLKVEVVPNPVSGIYDLKLSK
jgi:hypothetical protein